MTSISTEFKLIPEAYLAGPETLLGDAQGSVPVFPQRPGAQVCDFYVKTGHCKFGDQCRFDHPLRCVFIWAITFLLYQDNCSGLQSTVLQNMH